MSVQWTEDATIAFLQKHLSKDFDKSDREQVEKQRRELEAVADNTRRAVSEGKLEITEKINSLLNQCKLEHMSLQFDLKLGGATEEPPLLGEKVDAEVMLKVAEACSLLGLKVPKGYTGRMFQRWGFMIGMVRQVNAVKKIGTKGFLALAEIGALDCSAEYIVYHKAQEYGEQVTQHLAKGCIEKMEEALKEHNAI